MTEETKTVEDVLVASVEDVSLEVVEKTIDEVVSKNEAVTAENASLKAEAEKASEELVAIKADLEEIKAKQAAPTFIRNLGDKQDMESRDLFKTFIKEGADGLRSKAADLQISTDAQGGYALPEELRQEIIKIQHEVSPMRQVCSVAQAATTDVKQLVSTGSAASGWVGETTARAQTDSPELAQRTATFGEVYARPRVYQHLIEDGFFNVEDWLLGEVARQFSEAEGVAFLSGNGTNKPVGILNGLTLNADGAANDGTGAFEVLNTGTNNAIAASDAATIEFLRTVVKAVKTPYLPNCRWMMNRSTHQALINLKNSDGEYFLQRDLTQAGATSLFGHGIVINEDMDGIDEAAHSAPIMFGDFARAFQIVDRVDVSVLRDPYTNPGSVMFYSRKRVGSMVLDAQAMKVVGVTHA
jgi:HK97 family phage major capsid protein